MKKYIFLLLLVVLCPSAYAQGTIQNQKVTVLEGTLSQVSKLPVAETNPYPDCYYTAVVNVDHIVSGNSIPKRVILVLPGFFDRKYAPEAKFKSGDKISAAVVPFASMPEKVRQTQQADDIEDVDLEFYFPNRIALVQQFGKATNAVPVAAQAAKRVAVAGSHPVDEKARAARREAMQHDLDEINKLLAEHGGDWDKWYQSLQGYREQYKKKNEEKAQRWVGNSFFSAGAMDNGRACTEEFIKSIVDFKNYLAARNVDLILVRVPQKGEIADDLFASTPADGVANPYILRMYKELLEADVEIISDIIPKAKEERLKYPLMYYYQDFTEVHPAEGMDMVVAREFAKRISRYERVRSAPKKRFKLKTTVATPGWLGLKWPAGNPKFRPSDFVRFPSVVDDKGKPVALKQGTQSPVLVLGSSFIATPSLEKDATIPHYLAYLTGIVPDLLHRKNGDAMMPRTIARLGDDFLKNRSVCVFPLPPFVPYHPLAALPIFDAERSAKTLLASYSGKKLQDVVEYPHGAAKALSFAKDGTIHVPPATRDNDTPTTFTVKVPEAVSKYPYFVCTFEFASKDRSSVAAKYSGQTDSLKRSETQKVNSDSIAFVTNPDRSLDIEITPDPFLKTPVAIKAIKFYGVSEPSYYKTGE